MVNCSFCGKPIEKGTGKIYVKNDGRIFYFDNNKCEKNMFKLERLPRKHKWTKFYEKGQK